MRKKILSMFLLMVCLVIVTAGCNQDSANTAQVSKTAGTGETSIPGDDPALMGKVKEIIGNEVTIYEMAVPDNNQAGPPPQENILPDTSPRYALEEEAPINAETAGSSDDFAPTIPIPTESTETVTFLIPAGTPIIGMNTGQEGTSLLTLSDISEGSTIRVWKNDGIITTVQVMGSGKTPTRDKETNTNQMGPGGMAPGGGMPPGGGNTGITQSLGGSR